MQTIPTFLKKYFWDIKFNALGLTKSKPFIIKRLLEYGDEKSIRWMGKMFTRSEITKILSFARMDPKSANFWALVLNIKKENVLCLQKHYLQIRKKVWPY